VIQLYGDEPKAFEDDRQLGVALENRVTEPGWRVDDAHDDELALLCFLMILAVL
jgi:hypothetical protein